jgi:hypothetical protein
VVDELEEVVILILVVELEDDDDVLVLEFDANIPHLVYHALSIVRTAGAFLDPAWSNPA